MKKITMLLATMLIGIMTFAQTIAEFKSVKSQQTGGKEYVINTTIDVYKSPDGVLFVKETIDRDGKLLGLFLVKEQEVIDDDIYMVRAIGEDGERCAFIFNKTVAMMVGETYKILYHGKVTIKNW